MILYKKKKSSVWTGYLVHIIIKKRYFYTANQKVKGT